MNPDAPNSLDRVMRIIGWGDLCPGGLWFLGIEEGKPWKDVAAINEYFARPAVRQLYLQPIDQLVAYESGGTPGEERNPDTPVADWESKIAVGLQGAGGRWQDFRSRDLWRAGKKIFHGNLYPLGKSRLAEWPPHYERLFGLTSRDAAKYIDLVEQRRLPAIRELSREIQPSTIICFGKGRNEDTWNAFRRAFALADGGESLCDGRIRVYGRERPPVMLTPFFGQGEMRDAFVGPIVEQLATWGVHL